MDSLTQVVLGAAVGEAALGKKIGNRAIVWGGIAGTIPDLDVLITDNDTFTMCEARHFKKGQPKINHEIKQGCHGEAQHPVAL